MLIDTHCHLSELSDEELSQVLQRSQENGVRYLIAIGAGYGQAGNSKTLKLAQSYPHIFCALGTHPHDAKNLTNENFAALKKLASHEKVRAVGEIGLDYHYMNSPQDIQQQVLRRFIALAKEIKKPVVIHDRDTAEACLDILKSEGASQVGGVVHCFTGSKELAAKYLDLGFYLSFTGIITFKKADDLREVVKMVPLKRMLIETDAPFLAPLPHRGKKNEPAFVKHVAECVAAVKNLSFHEVAAQTSQNAIGFFNLPIENIS